ncbi:MAG: tRNA (N(6)-L-threonylcarbamoyladenosine(37)-C(2))-methylthiotransferase MtaB [Candidatus Aminicenantes bacterium]|nr:MAG: tRNA (N(6)-L-threonylcarbamoyladenosine(37)-C(2))-methylthiotransferase MtaB [Candidatus Aminicenantes bacterium]
MTSFSIQTFGCRVNQAEAFSWADEFQSHGLRYEKDFTRSDFIVVNSCTLTSRADRDVRNFIKKASRLNPKARLILTGCYVERSSEEFGEFPQVWLLLSNADKKSLPAKVLTFTSSQEEILNFPFRSRALVKIQDGCSFHCAFCVIPNVRGPSVSFEKKEVLIQIKKLMNQGFREIVLTGIHLCSYGLDLNPKSSLLKLLEEIERLDGLGRVRLSSLDPRFLSPALLEHITTSKKICAHFHLSLQHGSDEILKRMGRKISVKDYRKILSFLRHNSPLASLGTDLIVGFPGETEEDFEATHNFLEQSPLTYFHVFSYSPRPGTIAGSWPQLNSKIKYERAALLRELARKKNTNFRRLFVGKECDAVVIKNEEDGTEVLTSNYIKVLTPSSCAEEKEEVKVIITRVTPRETFGEISGIK